jgi:D-beta-D-heptose 7-phosphate kinase/D-beta-D-heptose 1-phosphate adenosyltransferase
MLFLGNIKTAKIQSRAALRRIVSRLKTQNKHIVFTNGCFDLLHLGHVRLFKKARSLGDVLIVGINGDASLKRLKGPKRPLVPQAARAEILASLEAVDFVTVFDEDTPAALIAALRPDILVKGGDYRLDQIVGREHVRKVVRFRFVEGQSTTGLIQEIVKRYGNVEKRS